MPITRADIVGALKLLNANEVKDRLRHLRTMLEKEHSARDVKKAMDDLESYPEWQMRRDLDTPVDGGTTNPAAPFIFSAEPPVDPQIPGM